MRFNLMCGVSLRGRHSTRGYGGTVLCERCWRLLVRGSRKQARPSETAANKLGLLDHRLLPATVAPAGDLHPLPDRPVPRAVPMKANQRRADRVAS